jgi:hypothetical protein
MTKPYTQMLRAFIEPDKKKSSPSKRNRRTGASDQKMEMDEIKRMLGPVAWPWFGPALILDCETETGIGQKLRFGVFQERGLNYRDLVERKRKQGEITQEDIDCLRSEGIFYNPEACSNEEIATMRAYANEHELRFIDLNDFLYDVFYRAYYYKQWNEGDAACLLPKLVIGHNLPFDLGAISYRAGPSKNDNYGGLTLSLAEARPPIVVKKLGHGKHLFSASPDFGMRKNHRFLDTMQLGRAMFGPGDNGMKGLLKKLKIADVSKGEADYEGPITREYIQYCRDDVHATWRIYEELRALWRKHGRSREIDRIYSEASIGKAYLKDFGITPFMKQNPNFDRRVIGACMETLYGGRSDVRIRHKVVEIIKPDFRSQYPSVNTLMKLQELRIAERIEAIEGGPNDKAARFLRGVTLDDMQNKDTWPKLRGVALIRPAGDILPVRTVYHANGFQDEADATLRAQQIGFNVVVSGPRTWYSFADIIASKLLTGKCPEILKTIELVPHGVQAGLKPVLFFGRKEYEIDLTRDDCFQRVIDMRAEVRDDDPAMGQGLKLMANGTAYGVSIEFIVDEHKDAHGTTVYHGEESSRREARAALPSDDGGYEISGYKVERAGDWFEPWGPLIPAGGRLLLAIAERLASDRGIGYGFCDTDAMGFARPDGMSRDEFRVKVHEIAGANGWFQKLNPYVSNDPLFSIEDENYSLESLAANKKDKSVKKELEPLHMLAVSAKRYALANKSGDEWIIRKASGHGLGHISAPSYDETTLPIHPAAPFEIKKDETSSLWFGVRGEWSHGKLSNARAPKLICDLWRIAFKAAENDEDIEFAVDEALDQMPGLDEPQFQQRALSSRADWLAYDHLPDRRAFMFFNILPPPVSTVHEAFFETTSPTIEKVRADLFASTLYSKFFKKDLDPDEIRRADNNEHPSQIFYEPYALRLCSVADSLKGYFGHSEMKSRGEKGVLQRLRMNIIDHEYIGKESNSLIDPDVDDAGVEEIEDEPNVKIFRRGFNSELLRGLDLDTVAEQVGIKPETLRDAFNQGRRLDEIGMRKLRVVLEADDDGVISLAPSEAIAPERKRAVRMRKNLLTLHKALAKGKDFDLNGPRRSALLNKRCGPPSLDRLSEAVERHLPDPQTREGKRARRFLNERIVVFWRGDADTLFEDYKREVELIETAIEIASGVKRAKVVRLTRNGGVKTQETRAKAKAERAAQQRRLRAERNATVKAIFIAPVVTAENEIRAVEKSDSDKPITEFFSIEWLTDLCRVLCALFVASVLSAFFKNEVEGAHAAAIRRASPDTAGMVFVDDLRRRIEGRSRRREADKMRKRRSRALVD